SLAALARQPQALAVHRPGSDARLDGMRHAPQPPLLVVLGHRQLQLERRAAKSVFDADPHGDFEILSRHAGARAGKAPGPAARTEAREQVGEVHVFERKLTIAAAMFARPFRRRAELLTCGRWPSAS